MNNVVLAGRLVADPELKTIASGVEMTSFRLAVNQDYAKSGEDKKADFFNITAWRQTAAFICKYFHKGNGIVLKGRLQSRTYQAQDGSNRYIVEVVADNVEFPLSGGKSNDDTSNYAPTASAPTASAPAQTAAVSDTSSADFPVDDDLPF